MSSSYDVIVVGLGAVGSATLFQASMRGISVLGIDQFEPPHEQGSSHGRTRFTRLGTGEGSQYYPLVKRSHEIWHELTTLREVELFTKTGGLIFQSPGPTDPMHGQDDFFATLKEIAEAHSINHQFLDSDQIEEKLPGFELAGDEFGYYEPGAGILRPEACIEAQLGEARRHGATINCNERVLCFFDSGRTITLRTDRADYQAHKVVISAGPWLGSLFPEFARDLQVFRQLVFWFGFDDRRSFEKYSSTPAFVWDSPAGLFYGFRPIEGQSEGLKVAAEQRRVPTVPGSPHQRFIEPDRTFEKEASLFFDTFLKGRLHGVSSNLVTAEACTYTVTPDQHFVIDFHPRHKNIVVASPCSGHGFKASAAVGEILADLATSGRTNYDISDFTLDRFER